MLSVGTGPMTVPRTVIDYTMWEEGGGVDHRAPDVEVEDISCRTQSGVWMEHMHGSCMNVNISSYV